jgi:hypothetical protein
MKTARRVLIAALAAFAACLAVWFSWQAYLRSAVGRENLQTEAMQTPRRALDWPVLLDAQALRLLPCGTALRLEQDSARGQCLLVLAGGKLVLVQAGEGAAAGLAELGAPLQLLDAVILLDLSAPSISGLDGVRDLSWLAGRQSPLRVIGPPGVETVTKGLDLSREQADAIATVSLTSGGLRFDAAVMHPSTVAPLFFEPERAFDTGDLIIDAFDDGAGGLILMVRYGEAIAVIASASAKRERVLKLAMEADWLVLPGMLHDWLAQEAKTAQANGQRRQSQMAQGWTELTPDARDQVFALRTLRPTQFLLWPLLPSAERPVAQLAWTAAAVESPVGGINLAREGQPITIASTRSAVQSITLVPASPALDEPSP